MYTARKQGKKRLMNEKSPKHLMKKKAQMQKLKARRKKRKRMP
jgi:hypothetical protein